MNNLNFGVDELGDLFCCWSHSLEYFDVWKDLEDHVLNHCSKGE